MAMTASQVQQIIDDTITVLKVPLNPDYIDFADRMTAVFRSYGYNTEFVDAMIRLAQIPPPIECLERLRDRRLILRLIGRFS